MKQVFLSVIVLGDTESLNVLSQECFLYYLNTLPGTIIFSNDRRLLLFPLSHLFGSSAFLLAFVEQHLNVFLPSAVILKFRVQTHQQNSKDHVQPMDTHWVVNNLHLNEEFFFKFLYFFIYFTLQYCIGFSKHKNESSQHWITHRPITVPGGPWRLGHLFGLFLLMAGSTWKHR